MNETAPTIVGYTIQIVMPESGSTGENTRMIPADMLESLWERTIRNLAGTSALLEVWAWDAFNGGWVTDWVAIA